jgi:hypothetical protein
MTRWLELDFTGPERQYNPEIRDFLAELLAHIPHPSHSRRQYRPAPSRRTAVS